jgi:hypothetical protein
MLSKDLHAESLNPSLPEVWFGSIQQQFIQNGLCSPESFQCWRKKISSPTSSISYRAQINEVDLGSQENENVLNLTRGLYRCIANHFFTANVK